jgi:hypothetical protein
MKASRRANIGHFQTIQKLSREMVLTTYPLQNDLDFAVTQWSKEKANLFWRRSVIRCLLVLIEAVLWNMKNLSLKISEVSVIKLTDHEISIAIEKRTVMKGEKLETKKNFLPFKDNIKATFKMFAKVHDVPFAFNADKNFDALCDTYELRSRLMHPKRPFDPNVSDSDIEAAEKGTEWLAKEWGPLMAACGKAASEITQER